MDIWAPGHQYQDDGARGRNGDERGTSYSAPHVAGTAEFYLSRNARAGAADVEAALRASARYPGTFSKELRAIRIVYAGAY